MEEGSPVVSLQRAQSQENIFKHFLIKFSSKCSQDTTCFINSSAAKAPYFQDQDSPQCLQQVVVGPSEG
jgi:hypothetical protein